MDPAITSSIISVIGTLLVAIIGKMSFTSITSKRFRSTHSIPDIKGTRWLCEWFYENDELYIKDEMEIVKWTKDGRFKGVGHQVRGADPAARVFNYPISGEISPSRVVVLTYKAEKYPTEAHIGMACVQLTVGADQMLGHWCGLASGKSEQGTKIATLRHGKVNCTKLR